MGFFSWKTSDTEESIPSFYSTNSTFPVTMITEDGKKWHEPSYEGYGVFGGKDIYELIAELNGLGSDRSEGIEIVFKDNKSGEFDEAVRNGVKCPKLIKDENLSFDSVPYPETCDAQGFFYGGDEEDEY